MTAFLGLLDAEDHKNPMLKTWKLTVIELFDFL